MISKTILLTGATGFLGSYLLDALISEGYRVIILKRSFSSTWRICNLLNKIMWYDIDKVSLEKPFKENRIDIIIHSATNYGRKGEKIYETVETNLLFPLKLIELGIMFNVYAFLNTDTLLWKYLSSYTLSKKQFLEWLIFFKEKIKVVNFRLEHIYGPKDDEGKFVVWLIKELLKENEEIKLTKGEQKRDFIYITDVVSAYITVLKNINKLSNFSEFDIGTGNFISIREFVLKVKDVIEKIIGRQIKTFLNFGAFPYREGEFMEIKEDLTKIFELGWNPNVNLDEGLKNTIEYYIKGEI